MRVCVRSHSLIYVRRTLGIRHVRSNYADIRDKKVVLYAEDKLFLGYVQNLSAFARV